MAEFIENANVENLARRPDDEFHNNKSKKKRTFHVCSTKISWLLLNFLLSSDSKQIVATICTKMLERLKIKTVPNPYSVTHCFHKKYSKSISSVVK